MRGKDLLSLSFRIIGLLFVAIGAVVAAATTVFVTRAQPVEGRVVDYSVEQNAITFMNSDESTGMLFYPIVEYQAEGGGVHRITGRMGRASRAYDEGTPLTVLVSATDPTDARINTVFGVWGSAIILGGLGAVFLLLSALAPYGFGGMRPGPRSA
jgi:hypothetical protein